MAFAKPGNPFGTTQATLCFAWKPTVTTIESQFLLFDLMDENGGYTLFGICSTFFGI